MELADPGHDSVRTASVAGLDVRFPDDIGAEHLIEQLKLRSASVGRRACDLEDRAVVLDQSNRPVGLELHVAQIALFVLDGCQLADPVDQRRIWRQPIGQAPGYPLPYLGAALLEDPLYEFVAADRVDRLEQSCGEPVVVGWEETLR